MRNETKANHERYPADMPLPRRTWRQRLVATLIILVLLAGGVAVSGFLLKTRPMAKRKPPAKMRVLVETKTRGAYQH